jgi:hypothetical protein
MHDETWSKAEKDIARRAFDQALSRELAALADEVRLRANAITEPRHIWSLNDFLTRRRREIDHKYDYRYSQLIFVFARLINDGWLKEVELAGLAEDKLAKIGFMLEK